MVYLSEFFPNPAGKDTGNEWIEVCNDSAQSQSLAGWKLQDASAKSFTIGDVSVAPQSCVVFGNTETKISLNNDKETISLFDAGGILQDAVSYSKAVKDNQALARNLSTNNLQLTTTPTKGEMKNVITGVASKIKKVASSTNSEAQNINSEVPQGGVLSLDNETGTQTLTSGTNIFEVIVIGVCVAGVLAYVFTKIAIALRATDKRGLDADIRRYHGQE